jgi:uncharacterized protein
MGAMLLELSAQVQAVYAELDALVARYAAVAGLRCPPGCSVCCQSEKVEATVLELLPLAFTLFRTGQAELLYRRLARGGGGEQCLLFRPDLAGEGGWGCSQYPFRTVVCRLFGFAGNRDRTGVPRLAACRVMREAGIAIPSEGGFAAEVAPLLPLFAEAGLRITALHPGLGTSRRPINQALREALEKAGMALELAAGQNRTAAEELVEPPVEPPDQPLPKAA